MPAETSTIQSGKLNRRIALQTPIDTPDGQRGVTRTWITLPGCSSVPAAMEYEKGGEAYFAQQVYPSVFVLFTIRFRPNLNIDDIQRVVYGKSTFNIRLTL